MVQNIKFRNAILIAMVTLLVAISIIIFKPVEQEPEPVISQDHYIPPAPQAMSHSPVVFKDVSDEAGIHYVHDSGKQYDSDGNPTRYMPESMGPGVALLDYDLDGNMDVLVSNSNLIAENGEISKKSSPRLLKNLGGLKFKDVTESAGLEFPIYGMGISIADIDADQYPDILLTAWGGAHLFMNKGNGKFERSDLLGIESDESELPLWTTSALIFDADGDLDLDIYLAQYVQWAPSHDVFATLDGVTKSYATPNLYEGSTSLLLIQENGKFIDKTEGSGMAWDDGKSLGAALWDFNDDGKMDIVVANDTQPNFLYLNQGSGKFEDRGLEAGIAYDENGKTRAGMGIDIADIANDGHACIAIGNFSREPVSVFRHDSGVFFKEVSQMSGVAESTYLPLTFGLTFADFNLDGWLDIVMANGHIEPEIQNVEAEISYRQSMIMLGNTGSGNFENWSPTAGEAFDNELVGRGIAAGDLDNDGDLDLVVTENSGPLHILENQSPKQNYLRLKLKGTAPNTNAIGAKIKLFSNNMMQTRYIRTGSSYLSQSEFIQTFGLGEANKIERLDITWPGGKSLTYTVDNINTLVEISEGDDRQVTVR